MNKDDLLSMIAESAYNVGFGAKLHFSTLDIVEKAPGWVNVIGFVVGVYSLIFPALALAGVSATLIIASSLTIYINFYNSEKDKYDKAGVALTGAFHELRQLYSEVKAQPDSADMSEYAQKRMAIVNAASGVALSKQIFLATWYAHMKFFWQHQVGWVNDELQLTFFRDKVPLSAWVTLVLLIGCGIAIHLHPSLLTVLFTSPPCTS
ncbi:SLATT domain-containing protein [Burkholderia glumae]|uniref:SLATT domain-containing protein n=1 Tax=Burkholderia glumae TaxID=337 RepID=UPI0020374E86|nr:SLATT domain-containing protein [Burkholderia glumae]MCM2547254.1 SLATT domain-containing protein [Burkholderia glumae]